MKTAITSENEHADGQMTTNPADNQLVTIVLLVLATVIAVPILFMSFGMLGSGPMMGGMWVLRRGRWNSAVVDARRRTGGAAVCSSLPPSPPFTCSTVRSQEPATQIEPFEELRLAYARGDITDEEYEQGRNANSAKTLSNEIPDCCLPAPQLTDSRDETAWASVVSDDHDFDPVHAVEVTESVR